MLSKNAVKLLKWLNSNDQWMTKSEIIAKCKYYDERALKALNSAKYINRDVNLDSQEWNSYRISDLGKAYLEGIALADMENIREWLSFGLSVAAIVISVIALLTQQGML